MKNHVLRSRESVTLAVALLLMCLATTAGAVIDGVSGTTFNLTARQGTVSSPDGASIPIWGYAVNGGNVQYPGPTLIVNQGDLVTINLTNELPQAATQPVSIVFPGQQGVSASGGSMGLLTRESSGGTDTVTYQFTASHAGTYMYQSGSQPQLQVEMGLVGVLIVRPPVASQAYGHADTAYDREYLIMLSEMDPKIHMQAALGLFDQIDFSSYLPVYWFINGRNFPDTVAAPGTALLPSQPYNSLVQVHPGETALLRFAVASRHLHPFHPHGNHFRLIARDGRMLQSAPGAGVDVSYEDYTLQAVPGATYDTLWKWTGEKLGWDILGTGPEFAHECTDGNGDDFDDSTYEYCPDHGKLIPVKLPAQQELTFGGFYSGSPFLGAAGPLPPGEGGLNLDGGLFFPWHSHSEKEIVNYDIFIGGMMTVVIVQPAGVPIP